MSLAWSDHVRFYEAIKVGDNYRALARRNRQKDI